MNIVTFHQFVTFRIVMDFVLNLLHQEVLLVPQPEDGMEGCSYYMTLMRDGEMQLHVGDAVYVTQEDEQRANRALGMACRDRLDIFRIERLWIADG